jgi:hypothetical protein
MLSQKKIHSLLSLTLISSLAFPFSASAQEGTTAPPSPAVSTDPSGTNTGTTGSRGSSPIGIPTDNNPTAPPQLPNTLQNAPGTGQNPSFPRSQRRRNLPNGTQTRSPNDRTGADDLGVVASQSTTTGTVTQPTRRAP